MANFFWKLKVIMWKNFKLRQHCWLSTLFEICIPVLLLLVLLKVPVFPEAEYIDSTINHNKTNIYEYKKDALEFLFAPNNSITIKIMEQAVNSDTCDECSYLGFENEDALLRYAYDSGKLPYNLLVGVLFDDISNSVLPEKLNYRIRLRTATYLDEIENLYSSSNPFTGHFQNYYLDTHFIWVQYIIDKAFIDLKSGSNKFNALLSFEEIPVPPHWNYNFINSLFVLVLSVITLLSSIKVFINLLVRIMEEKSSGIKELMKMMGLDSWMLWLGWYIYAMLMFLLISFIFVYILKVHSELLQHSNSILFWIFIFLYFHTGVCFCFFFTTCFRKSTMTINLGTIVWVGSVIPVYVFEYFYERNEMRVVRRFLSFTPNSCLVYGFKTLQILEDQGYGLNWRNIYTIPDNFVYMHDMGSIFHILIIDSLIFLLLTWYIDNVNPGDYGIGASIFFPFKTSYWFSKVAPSIDISDVVDSKDEIEAPSDGLNPTIQIRNLHKIFNKKMAVNGLNFNIYNNEITVLLGHNGAGKTTTINMVTGMIAPTEGTVFVNGYDIRVNIDKIRESLGLCPQYNVQFPELTVQEHLIFFSMLKGFTLEEARAESLHILSVLSIESKKHERAQKLSGGMRRRLSLGIALVGKSKVLMLDEPTSGMDPETRREFWNVIMSMRGERTILITTHFMDEADILGDRIAIMYGGQLVCYGTSMFLKKRYGSGYILTILVERNYNLGAILNVVENFIPNTTIRHVSTGSVKLQLPTNDTKTLSELFLDLEEKKRQLNVTSFGVSITTMDDVFLQVGKEANEYHKDQTDANMETILLNDEHSCHEGTERYNTGIILCFQHLFGLFKKRIQFLRYNWLHFILGILFSLSIILLYLAPSAFDKSSNNIIPLTLKSYKNSRIFYSDTFTGDKLSSYYVKSIEDQNSKTIKTTNVSMEYERIAEEDLYRYYTELITAAEFHVDNDSIQVNNIFNRWTISSPSITVNSIMNALLKYYTNNDNMSITIKNNPFESDLKEPDCDSIIGFIPFAVILFIVFLFDFHISEYQSGVKHLQIMSGISRTIYWFSNYIIDILFSSIIIIIIILIIISTNDTVYKENALGECTLLIFLFLLSAFPFMYFFHHEISVGRIIATVLKLQIVFGFILPVITFAYDWVGETDAFYNIVHPICLFIPHYVMTRAILILSMRVRSNCNWNLFSDVAKLYACSGEKSPEELMNYYPCCDPNSEVCKQADNYFIGKLNISNEVNWLVFHIFFYGILFLLYDYGYITKWFDEIIYNNKYITKREKQTTNDLDEDVLNEKNRVQSQFDGLKENHVNVNNLDVLLVSDLHKWYQKFYAVRGITFGVKHGECFGLLGINGAGKTTTFKMLTGEIFSSVGEAFILGYSLNKNKKMCMQQIGYCPQFAALNFHLTTRQMLTFFAHVRGIRPYRIRHHVDKWLTIFELMQYENIQCGQLSEGNKRKLSTSMALIGNPPLLMLDEPTTGVDPIARRTLWNVLSAVRKSGQAIVFTSHSMDECEALCDRLTIMVDGNLKCIGNIQHLKTKFGTGFNVNIKLQHNATDSQIDNLKAMIHNKYMCSLIDEHKGMLVYHITDAQASLGKIFEFMEDVKSTTVVLEDFSVSDTTLEQVFISFAKERHEMYAEGTV